MPELLKELNESGKALALAKAIEGDKPASILFIAAASVEDQPQALEALYDEMVDDVIPADLGVHWIYLRMITMPAKMQMKLRRLSSLACPS
jgi:hypothetical protein